MGNPAFNFGDGGACWDCEHYRGMRTEPDRRPLTLCGQGMPHTYTFKSLPPDKGCRYWMAPESLEDAQRSGGKKL